MIRHFAGLAEVVEDVPEAVERYRQQLGLEVEFNEENNYGQVKLPGILHYGIWSRQDAAQAIYGDAARAADVPLGFLIGFEVDSVDAATAQAAGQGLDFAQGPKTEPWGQATSRFHMPSGAMAELSETPWARNLTQEPQAEGEDE